MSSPSSRGPARILSPPLIKTLGYLGATRNGYWQVPCSEDRRTALNILSMAAVDAKRCGIPFTREYIADYLVRQKFGQAFCDSVRVWLNRIHGELKGFGEVLEAIEWVCLEINDLSGLTLSDIMQTIDRKGRDEPAPMDGNGYSGSLNHVAQELRKLDANGQGKEIFLIVCRKCRLLRDIWDRLSNVAAPGSENSGAVRPRATVNSRMIEVFQKDHEASGWTAKQWAIRLKCSPAAVVGTSVWKNLTLEREQGKAERASRKAAEKRINNKRLD
jgi:hypothetical protein